MPQLQNIETTKMTSEQFLRDCPESESNHEIWRKCICGNEEDLRMTYTCSECGTVLYIPKKVKHI